MSQLFTGKCLYFLLEILILNNQKFDKVDYC